jgi:glyoxylase-like metal-dependent hydrolase (beta-lactamase superfamily II)
MCSSACSTGRTCCSWSGCPRRARLLFTGDGAAALAALDALDDLDAAMLLPGHGQPFAGRPHAAAEQARRAGLR